MRETIFPETHEYVRAKMLGKKLSQKFSKKKFLYSLEYRDQKSWEKMREQFFQKHTNGSCKNVGENNVAKKCEKTLFIFTRIS